MVGLELNKLILFFSGGGKVAFLWLIFNILMNFQGNKVGRLHKIKQESYTTQSSFKTITISFLYIFLIKGYLNAPKMTYKSR